MQPTYIHEGKLIPSTNTVMLYMSLPFSKALQAYLISNSQSPHKFLAFCAFSLLNQFLQLIVTEQEQVFLAFHVQCDISKYYRKYLYQV